MHKYTIVYLLVIKILMRSHFNNQPDKFKIYLIKQDSSDQILLISSEFFQVFNQTCICQQHIEYRSEIKMPIIPYFYRKIQNFPLFFLSFFSLLKSIKIFHIFQYQIFYSFIFIFTQLFFLFTFQLMPVQIKIRFVTLQYLLILVDKKIKMAKSNLALMLLLGTLLVFGTSLQMREQEESHYEEIPTVQEHESEVSQEQSEAHMRWVPPSAQCLLNLDKIYQNSSGNIIKGKKGGFLRSCRSVMVSAKGDSPFKIIAECDTGKVMPGRWKATATTPNPIPSGCA